MNEADTSRPRTGDDATRASSTSAAEEKASEPREQDAMPTVPQERIEAPSAGEQEAQQSEAEQPATDTAASDTATRELRDDELFDVIVVPSNNRVEGELLPNARVSSYQPKFTGNYPSSGYSGEGASAHRAPHGRELVPVRKAPAPANESVVSVSPVSFAALLAGSISIVVAWVGVIIFPPFVVLGAVGCVVAIVLGFLGVALEPKGKPFSISGLSLGSIGCVGMMVVMSLVLAAFMFMLWLATVLAATS